MISQLSYGRGPIRIDEPWFREKLTSVFGKTNFTLRTIKLKVALILSSNGRRSTLTTCTVSIVVIHTDS